VPKASAPAQTSNSDAAKAKYKEERTEEIRVTGKTIQQCRASFKSCQNRIKAQVTYPASIAAIHSECDPFYNACTANAASSSAEKAKPADEGGDGGGQGGGQGIATVLQSVDVYDSPGGNGQKTGNLRKGSQVSLIGECNDGWCHVGGRRVPNGDGYVYNGDDYKSLDF
jgi:hypothetical protein